MATRSTIALEFADGTIQQVYCHWDGYLDHNGYILRDNYSNPFKLQELIDLGDLSVLGKEIGVEHPFDGPTFGTQEYADYKAKFGDMCKFYGRDRKEDRTSARRFVDFNNYKANAQQEEYNYILRHIDGEAVWYVAYYETGDRFIKLSEAIELEQAEKEE